MGSKTIGFSERLKILLRWCNLDKFCKSENLKTSVTHIKPNIMLGNYGICLNKFDCLGSKSSSPSVFKKKRMLRCGILISLWNPKIHKTEETKKPCLFSSKGIVPRFATQQLRSQTSIVFRYACPRMHDWFSSGVDYIHFLPWNFR